MHLKWPLPGSSKFIRCGVITSIRMELNAQRSTIILHKPENGSYETATIVKNEDKEWEKDQRTVYYIWASLSSHSKTSITVCRSGFLWVRYISAEQSAVGSLDARTPPKAASSRTTSSPTHTQEHLGCPSTPASPLDGFHTSCCHLQFTPTHLLATIHHEEQRRTRQSSGWCAQNTFRTL